MKVGQRLFLSVLPAVLGLFLVAALAYWGRYARAAPELVVILAAVAAVVSLIVAWRNTRYVVHRVQRLAGHSPSLQSGISRAASASRRDALRELGIRLPDARESDSSRDADELDHIEATVAGLSSAVVQAREDASRQEREALGRAREIEDLLRAATARFAARAQDAQLPLHILLSSPFGSLNENQEEMLGAALSAVDAIDTEVRELQKLLQLNRGEMSTVTQPINLAELLRPTLAIAGGRAESAHVQLRPDVSDTAPRAIVDVAHAQEALTSILTDAIAHTEAGGDVDVDAREDDHGRLRISVSIRPMISNSANDSSLELRVARRLLETQGGSITSDGAVTVIGLPSERASHVAR